MAGPAGAPTAAAEELRAPLTTVVAAVEMLLDGDAGEVDPLQAAVLATIDDACCDLRRVLDAVLHEPARGRDGAP